MSIHEFNSTTWKKGMTARHEGESFEIVAVDFEDNMVAQNLDPNGSDELNWFRYTEIELI